MRILLLLLVFTTSVTQSHGQVLISILLGDKLNSDKLEFGLDGGLSMASLHGLDPSKIKSSLNLGFYFDIKMKQPGWFVHTGVMVKSTMGAKDVDVYSLDNPDLDNSFKDGSVTRKLGYFNVPIMMKYKFKNNFFVEAGPMVGLMNRSTDEFVATITDKDDLTYKTKIRDRYHPLDAGAIAGIGYRLMGGNGMNIGIRYYYGFVDITVDDSTPNQYNRALYFAVGIPIGGAKKTVDVKN
ncbi:MAG TPA: porin family protein [Chryseolinea sp.]|nr:porin family protein [Chryseolinea sp.]